MCYTELETPLVDKMCLNLNNTQITLETIKDTCAIWLSHFKVEAKTTLRKVNWDTLSILALFNLIKCWIIYPFLWSMENHVHLYRI